MTKNNRRLLIAYLVMSIPAVIVLYFTLDFYFEAHFSHLNRAFFYMVSMLVLAVVLAMFVWLFHVRVDKKRILELNDLIAHFSECAIVILNKKREVIHINPLYETISGFQRSEIIGHRFTDKVESASRPTIDSRMFDEANAEGRIERILWSRTDHGVERLHRITCHAVKNRRNRMSHYVICEYSHDMATQMMLSFDTYRGKRMTEHMLAMPGIDDSIRRMAEEHETFSVLSFYPINVGLLKARFSQDEIRDAFDAFIRNLKRVLPKETGITVIEDGPFFILTHDLEDTLKAIDACAKTNYIKDEIVCLKYKVGIARYPDDTGNPRLLMSYAHLALTSGSEEIVYFKPSYALLIEREIEIENALRKAIDNDEFSLSYQPQIDIKDHRVVGIEALLRWRNEELGNVSPATFIPIAERYGYIGEIGVLVLHKIEKDIDVLASSGLRPRISINTSTRQLLDSNWYRSIETLVRKQDGVARQLSFEIDESALLTNVDHARSYIDALKELGVSLVIDNFGKGYSSFIELKRLPIDSVKIDRTFIINYPEEDGRIAASLLSLTKHLNLDVIVEGVENDIQKDFVVAHGARVIQGYLYARPLSLDDVITFIIGFERSLLND